jgi:hypothetical protein
MARKNTKMVGRRYTFSGSEQTARQKSAEKRQSTDGTPTASDEDMNTTLYVRPEAVNPAILATIKDVLEHGGTILPDRRGASVVPPAAPAGYVRYVVTQKSLREPLGPTIVAVYRLLYDQPRGLTLPQIMEVGPRKAKNTLRWAIQVLRLKGYVRSEG